MLVRFVDRFCRAKLNRGAVKSLEYAMIAMIVAVASVGAFSTPGIHTTQAQPQAASLVRVASAN
jgi:Flp pilus assembly pilin Flp